MELRKLILNDVADDVIARLQHEIEEDGLVFTGQLKNSWEKEANEDGSITVGSRLLWAKIMDDGRLPGKMPPVKKLMPWVVMKLGAKDEKDAMRKAYAVAKKIEQKGIEGRRYVKRALFLLENETS